LPYDRHPLSSIGTYSKAANTGEESGLGRNVFRISLRAHYNGIVARVLTIGAASAKTLRRDIAPTNVPTITRNLTSIEIRRGAAIYGCHVKKS
jgi:hypothetical protein